MERSESVPFPINLEKGAERCISLLIAERIVNDFNSLCRRYKHRERVSTVHYSYWDCLPMLMLTDNSYIMSRTLAYMNVRFGYQVLRNHPACRCRSSGPCLRQTSLERDMW